MKRFVALFMAIAMLFTLTPMVFAENVTTSKTTLAIGDKVKIGTYNGEDVEYIVLGSQDVDGDSIDELFLASSKIVAYKNFMEGKNPKYITNWESNHKGRPSTLRAWLNSDAAAGKVEYSLESGDTSVIYNGEAGFMNGMASFEKSQIVPVTHRATASNTAVAGGVYDVTDGGAGSYNIHGTTWENSAPYTADNNGVKYSEARYVETTDSVFIPSIQDIYDFFGGEDVAAVKRNMNVSATDAAQATVTDTTLYEHSKTLLRDTYYSNEGDSKVYGWYVEDNIVLRSTNEVYGVRPCMFIKADTEIEAAGTNVYKIKKTLAKGDKIQIGEYKGSPVEYTVMGKGDANGDGTDELFLASSKIVSFRAFNSTKASNYAVNWKSNHKGIPNTLRTWLNSDAEAGAVNYNLESGDTTNVYGGEAGFMSGMADYEKDQIVATTHKALASNDGLAGGIYDVTDGGSGVYNTWNTGGHKTFRENYPTNTYGVDYDDASYVLTTDKVFIPSLADIYNYFGGTTPEANMNVGATETAKAEVSDADYYNSSLTLLRDTYFTESSMGQAKVMRWVAHNTINNGATTGYVSGVRPCMFIKADTKVVELADGVYAIKEPVKTAAVGDRIEIGTYEGRPVEYQVMGSRDVDNDGIDELFLASSKIVSFKTYNAGKTLNWAANWKANNKGRTASLRTWLNSTDEIVDYGTESDGTAVAPTYAKQPGFMAGMKDYERERIVPVTQNTTVADFLDTTHTESGIPFDGGQGHFVTYNQTFPKAYTNNLNTGVAYEDAAYVTTTDHVFIPSIADLYYFFGGNVSNEAAVSKLNVGATEAAKAEASDASLYENSHTLLRDVYFGSGLGETYIYRWNGTYVHHKSGKASDMAGVRPCMYIEADTPLMVSGTSNNVYKMVPDTFIGYGQTTDGTVIRANIYNKSDSAAAYVMIVAGYDSENRLVSAVTYNTCVDGGYTDYLDSAVIDCGETDVSYNVFLWDGNGFAPIVEEFVINTSI